jgi:ornithine cyclodeaminase
VITVLDDADVRRGASAIRWVALMREALRASYLGELASPPRATLDAGATRLTIGAGGRIGGPVGFRAYGGWGRESDQLTAVWDGDGRLRGVVGGELFGILRTGALGGVAVDCLARPDADVVGVIGSGRMAWGQLWAICGTRSVRRIDVYSRAEDAREAFARRVCDELGVACRTVSSAEEATRGHGIVVVSTDAVAPVIRREWVGPGTHLTSTGPKRAGASELDPAIAADARVMVTDAPDQVDADADWFSERRPRHLGGILADAEPGRRSEEDVTLYCSVGLTGTEAVVGDELLSALR